MKRLLPILLGCLAAVLPHSPAAADVIYHGTTGQTLYVRVQTGASTFKGVAMTEGSSGGLGVYKTTDAALVSASITTASATAGFANGYPFTIRSGSASDTANDTILASGQLCWSGSVELSDAANVRQISDDSTAADNAESFFDGTGYGPLLLRTTVSSVTSQTVLVLTAGPESAGSLIGCTVIVRDVAGSTNKIVAKLTNYDDAGPAITIGVDGTATFTIAVGDIIEILPPSFNGEDRTAATTAQTKIGYLPSATAGASGGLLISGSNSGTTTLGALTVTGTTTLSDGLLVNRSSSNSSAAIFTGSGIGSGLRLLSGTGATGTGLIVTSQATNGNATTFTGAGIGAGAAFISGSGATGDGVSMTAASTNGSGLTVTGTGTGDDIKLTNSDSDTLEAALASLGGGGGGGGGADEDDIWSFDLASATGAATPGTPAFMLLNPPTLDDVGEELAQHIDLAAAIEEANLAHVTTRAVSQVPVPPARRWVLKQSSNGLVGEVELAAHVGESKTYSVDFRNDLATNGRVTEILSIEILEGEEEGVVLSEEDADQGVDKSEAKFVIETVTAGTYVIKVKVAFDDSDGGGEAIGFVTLVVAT